MKNVVKGSSLAKTWLVISALVLFAQVSLAADAPAINSSSTTNSESGFMGDLSVVAGLKSYNDTGRGSDGNGRTLKSKNEYYLGAKAKNGWGAYAMAVEQATSYSKASKNVFSPQDPSLSILHPIYTSDTLRMSGQFKQYFPVSDWSVTNKVYEQTYYMYLSANLSAGLDLFNVLIPRYFSQPKYAPGDTTFYTEDYTGISHNLAQWVRIGLGQHSQVEFHPITPTGTTVEVYPFADFMLSKSIYAGPRLYMPVFVQNTVFDAPKGVSTQNVQAELYVQATM